jgi:hypothetical protein
MGQNVQINVRYLDLLACFNDHKFALTTNLSWGGGGGVLNCGKW